ncbi:5444_t:CDS:2 [Gigaspora rosea]|nr:5444_t:CDS:2 [Gigaspora rosea]
MKDVTSNKKQVLIGGRPQEDIWNENNTINSGKGKHKGARCRYCSALWARERD